MDEWEFLSCPICVKLSKGFIMSESDAYSKLNRDQKEKVRNLVGIILKAISPDDSTGHLPNCGYTDDHQVCGCSDVGERLFNGLSEFIFKE